MAKTYREVLDQIEQLKKQAEALKSEEVAAVIARIKEAIQAYGLTADDLGLAKPTRQPKPTGKRRGRPPKAIASKATKSKKTARPAKYQDDQGNTWGGRGPRPLWLREALEGGRSLEAFARP